jgi:hypothetical protein
LLPDTNITFGGLGRDRFVVLTPTANKHGTVFVTLIVTDEQGLAAETAFRLIISEPEPTKTTNTPPVVSIWAPMDRAIFSVREPVVIKSLSENGEKPLVGPFVVCLRWRIEHSPLRGCTRRAASAATKIPFRSPFPLFQTGS